MICDRLRRIDAPVLVTLGAIVLQAPFFIAAYLVDSATLAVVLFIGGIFGASMVGGMQAAMVQSLSPSRMRGRSEEHTSELQSLMRISYAVFCLKKNKNLEIVKQNQNH